jgi:hypothetical protein
MGALGTLESTSPTSSCTVVDSSAPSFGAGPQDQRLDMPWPSLEWPIQGLMPLGPTGQVAMGSSQKVTWIQTPVQQETLRDETWGPCAVKHGDSTW